MAKVAKAQQIAYGQVVSLEKYVSFGVSPYEATGAVGGGIQNPANPLGYSWEGGRGSGASFLSSRAGTIRPDLKLTSFKMSGLGGTFTHTGRGKSLNYDQIYGKRGIRTELYELKDAGDSQWTCFSGGHVISSIILPQGATFEKGRNGVNSVTIQSATPNAFLAELELPQMPYILAKPANEERFSWWYLATNGYLPPPAPLPNPLPNLVTRKASIQNALGYPLQGTGKGGIADGMFVDPFAGFANYRDQYLLKAGELMQPVAANDLHFCNALSTWHGLVEIMTNHVKANGQPIGDTFNLEIRTDQSPERDLLHYEASGGINSIIQQAAQHGVARTWWDSRSNFHFMLDYYGGGGDGKVAMTLIDGPSFLGDIEVGPGSPLARINRVAVRGQPFLSFGDATTDPMSNNFDMVLGAVYPPGAPLGGSGSNIVQDNYMGKNAAAQAYKMFHKENAQTIFNWKNMVHPTLALGLFNREILIKAKDPKKGWNFSGGKRFIVTDVSGELTDADNPNGGYWLCSLSGIEI
ncbi:MAG: hypothetical protein H0X33_13250 [Taibaiella sp.]|nr:hypothetical protein [Taibaiella sp.]